MPFRVTKKRKPYERKVILYLNRGGRRRATYRPPRSLDSHGPSENTSQHVDISHHQYDDFSSAIESTSADVSTQPEMSSYMSKKKKRLEEWASIQPHLIEVGVEQFAPATFICCTCKVHVSNIIRCGDCGPCAYFCEDCFSSTHVCTLHVPVIWVGDVFLGYSKSQMWKRPDSHSCLTLREAKQLIVIDEKGRQHEIEFQFCGCEEPSMTLLRFGLWPSSPNQPSVAFHMKFLDWLLALQMESQVSVFSFCGAVKACLGKHQMGLWNRWIKNVYKTLVSETVEEYRYFKYHLTHPKDVSLDDGTVCPACKYSDELPLYSMDADFQLVRKASAGNSLRIPRHAGRFFVDQTEVDNFMSSYSNDAVKEADCSSFKAGSNVRSKGKSQKLDEKAVFGSCCRHDFPHKFFNLKHGERIGYSVFLLNDILRQNQGQVVILYDIACLLYKHLKKQKETDILRRVTFAVPIFHCYGHQAACQIKYSPRRIKGIGLTDGEGMERLWSYLGRFAKITKEMTPEGRQDLLTDALVYYGDKIKEKLVDLVLKKISRACSVRDSSEQELANTISVLPGVDRSLVEVWSTKEDEYFAEGSSQNTVCTVEEEYAANLQKLFTLKNAEGEATSDVLSDTYKLELKRVTSKINKLEKKLKITKRWTRESESFQVYCNTGVEKLRKQIVFQLKKQHSEKAFLFSLMKRYARGQAIANRITSQIKAVNKSVKNLIKSYNLFGACVHSSLPPEIKMENVKDISIADYPVEQNIGVNIPSYAIQCAVDSLNVHRRAVEEIDMCKKEIRGLYQYYCCLHDLLNQKINEDDISLGKKCLYILEGLSVESTLLSIFDKSSRHPALGEGFLSDNVPCNIRETYCDYIPNEPCDTTLNEIQNIESQLFEEDVIESDTDSEFEEC